MRLKLQFFATIVCLLGIAAGFACKLMVPQYWFDLYPVVLIIFWFMEMVISFVLERYESSMDSASISNNKWMKVQLVIKLTKLFITLALIFVGVKYLDSVSVGVANGMVGVPGAETMTPGTTVIAPAVVSAVGPDNPDTIKLLFVACTITIYLLNIAVESFVLRKR